MDGDLVQPPCQPPQLERQERKCTFSCSGLEGWEWGRWVGCISLCVPWQKEPGLSHMPPQHEATNVKMCLLDLDQLGTNLSLEGRTVGKGERGISLASNKQGKLGVGRSQL